MENQLVKTNTLSSSLPVDVWVVGNDREFWDRVLTQLNPTTDVRCSYSLFGYDEALELLAAGAAVEVLLLATPLSGMDGVEGLRKIKALRPALRVILLADSEDHAPVFQAICAGASGYLLKDSSPDQDQIVESVREVMAGGSPMSPRVVTLVLEMFLKLAQQPTGDFRLTERERQILELMKKGLIKKEIAIQMKLSFHTVDDYLRNIYRKLHVHNQAEAMAKAMKYKLL